MQDKKVVAFKTSSPLLAGFIENGEIFMVVLLIEILKFMDLYYWMCYCLEILKFKNLYLFVNVLEFGILDMCRDFDFFFQTALIDLGSKSRIQKPEFFRV